MRRRRPFFLEWGWVTAIEVLIEPLVRAWKAYPFSGRIIWAVCLFAVFYFLPQFPDELRGLLKYSLSVMVCAGWGALSGFLWEDVDNFWSKAVSVLMDIAPLLAGVIILFI